MESRDIPNAAREFSGADLGNSSRTARLERVAQRMESNPEASLPQQLRGPAELEGAYRLFENAEVEPQAVLDAHIDCTVERVKGFDEALALHDTTEFKFSGAAERKGLGYLNADKKEGFFDHHSLAVATTGEPLGTLHSYTWARLTKSAPIPEGKNRRRTDEYDPDRESLRWGDSALACAERVGLTTSLIHVMDREGDCLELFPGMLARIDPPALVRIDPLQERFESALLHR